MGTGGPDVRAARVVQNRGLFSRGRGGGDAPSPQLPKASVSASILPSGRQEVKSVCRADVIFFFFFLIVVGSFSEFFPLLHGGAWGLEKWTQGLGSASKMSWEALLHQLCPAWWSGQGGHPWG